MLGAVWRWVFAPAAVVVDILLPHQKRKRAARKAERAKSKKPLDWGALMYRPKGKRYDS